MFNTKSKKKEPVIISPSFQLPIILIFLSFMLLFFNIGSLPTIIFASFSFFLLLQSFTLRIVSRDVRSSSIKHLLRSSTESLTENSVDGIFGPLFWIFIGIIFMKLSIFLPGPLSLGFSYKAISTLDSMIGYKYDYFRYLGFFSAKIEDIFTFVPSRLVLITLPLVSSKVYEYRLIIKKSYLDGKKYDSPNAGISEAIFAYISGIKLGGKSKYKNEIVEKPIINETGDNCTEEKIQLICQLILRLQFLWIIIFALIFFIISSLT
ncbi:cobalamin biosynthesis protein [Prochlorococcus sp. AH-716-I05]|nr:cobalamin biosynthesis protein [Prochlorococcus sp. AH-716-I05]